MRYRWGIDLGGTKIEGVLLGGDGDRAKILKRLRIPTEQNKGYGHILQKIQAVVEALSEIAEHPPPYIGIGTPGVLDPGTKVMKNSNTHVLNGKTLDRDLEEILGVPVSMANDANCFAVAEARLGAASLFEKKPNVVFGVIMGTGVGGGIVISGKPLIGLHAIAGEWGHSFLDDSGYDCYCGKKGCVETIISGPALERYYREISGQTLPLTRIIEHARIKKNEAAVKTLDRLIHFFGKGLSQIINILDPEVIVLGGGLSNVDELYSLGFSKIKQFIFNDRVETKILKPVLGDSAGVIGAALLPEPK